MASVVSSLLLRFIAFALLCAFYVEEAYAQDGDDEWMLFASNTSLTWTELATMLGGENVNFGSQMCEEFFTGVSTSSEMPLDNNGGNVVRACKPNSRMMFMGRLGYGGSDSPSRTCPGPTQARVTGFNWRVIAPSLEWLGQGRSMWSKGSIYGLGGEFWTGLSYPQGQMQDCAYVQDLGVTNSLLDTRTSSSSGNNYNNNYCQEQNGGGGGNGVISNTPRRWLCACAAWARPPRPVGTFIIPNATTTPTTTTTTTTTPSHAPSIHTSTNLPSFAPSRSPSVSPTNTGFSGNGTNSPTSLLPPPSPPPTWNPSHSPSAQPTASPTVGVPSSTVHPTKSPTASPIYGGVAMPSATPSHHPSEETHIPSASPTVHVTDVYTPLEIASEDVQAFQALAKDTQRGREWVACRAPGASDTSGSSTATATASSGGALSVDFTVDEDFCDACAESTYPLDYHLVQCESNGTHRVITEIRLVGAGLNGTVPVDALAAMTHLRVIDLGAISQIADSLHSGRRLKRFAAKKASSSRESVADITQPTVALVDNDIHLPEGHSCANIPRCYTPDPDSTEGGFLARCNLGPNIPVCTEAPNVDASQAGIWWKILVGMVGGLLALGCVFFTTACCCRRRLKRRASAMQDYRSSYGDPGSGIFVMKGKRGGFGESSRVSQRSGASSVTTTATKKTTKSATNRVKDSSSSSKKPQRQQEGDEPSASNKEGGLPSPTQRKRRTLLSSSSSSKTKATDQTTDGLQVTPSVGFEEVASRRTGSFVITRSHENLSEDDDIRNAERWRATNTDGSQMFSAGSDEDDEEANAGAWLDDDIQSLNDARRRYINPAKPSTSSFLATVRRFFNRSYWAAPIKVEDPSAFSANGAYRSSKQRSGKFESGTSFGPGSQVSVRVIHTADDLDECDDGDDDGRTSAIVSPTSNKTKMRATKSDKQKPHKPEDIEYDPMPKGKRIGGSKPPIIDVPAKPVPILRNRVQGLKEGEDVASILSPPSSVTFEPFVFDHERPGYASAQEEKHDDPPLPPPKSTENSVDSSAQLPKDDSLVIVPREDVSDGDHGGNSGDLATNIQDPKPMI